MPVVVVVSLVLNSLAMAVFLQPRLNKGRPAIYYYLIALALWDVAQAIGAFLMVSVAELFYEGSYEASFMLVCLRQCAAADGSLFSYHTTRVLRQPGHTGRQCLGHLGTNCRPLPRPVLSAYTQCTLTGKNQVDNCFCLH